MAAKHSDSNELPSSARTPVAPGLSPALRCWWRPPGSAAGAATTDRCRGDGLWSVGQIGQGEGYRIVGQDAANQWWLICCVDGETAWVQQLLVAIEGAPAAVPVVTAAGFPSVIAPVSVPITGPAATPIAAPIVITAPGRP